MDPREARSRALILDAAIARFVESGYLATSIQDVARDAGVARRTVFNIYGDKDELFRAALRRSIGIALRFIERLTGHMRQLTDPSRELPDLAVELARTVLVGPVLPLRRVLISESYRFPDLAAEYYHNAPGRVIDALASSFRELGRRNLIIVEDPDAAAEHFALLVMGADLDRSMFGIQPVRDQAAIDARAVGGAHTFLRAYGAEDCNQLVGG